VPNKIRHSTFEFSDVMFGSFNVSAFCADRDNQKKYRILQVDVNVQMHNNHLDTQSRRDCVFKT